MALFRLLATNTDSVKQPSQELGKNIYGYVPLVINRLNEKLTIDHSQTLVTKGEDLKLLSVESYSVLWYNVALCGGQSASIQENTQPHRPMESGELDTRQHAGDMGALRLDGALKGSDD